MKKRIGFVQPDDGIKYTDTAGIDPVKYSDGGGGMVYSDGGTVYDNGGTAYTPPIVADSSSPYNDVDLSQLDNNILIPPGKPIYDSPPQLQTTNDGGGTQALLPAATGPDWLLLGGIALAAYFLFKGK